MENKVAIATKFLKQFEYNQYFWFPLHLVVSEKRSLKMLMDGWTTDACLYYKLTCEPSAEK